jgi:hypothetical protein
MIFKNMWQNVIYVSVRSLNHRTSRSPSDPSYSRYKKWIKFSMEISMGLPTLKGKDNIFVIVDRLTKYSHFNGSSSKAKANQIANIYVKNIYKLHGFLKYIINDRDPKFTNKIWKELFHHVGTTLTMST